MRENYITNQECKFFITSDRKKVTQKQGCHLRILDVSLKEGIQLHRNKRETSIMET